MHVSLLWCRIVVHGDAVAACCESDYSVSQYVGKLVKYSFPFRNNKLFITFQLQLHAIVWCLLLCSSERVNSRDVVYFYCLRFMAGIS